MYRILGKETVCEVQGWSGMYNFLVIIPQIHSPPPHPKGGGWHLPLLLKCPGIFSVLWFPRWGGGGFTFSMLYFAFPPPNLQSNYNMKIPGQLQTDGKCPFPLHCPLTLSLPRLRCTPLARFSIFSCLLVPIVQYKTRVLWSYHSSKTRNLLNTDLWTIS